MGRQSTFTQALADEICERLCKGETLASICRDDDMPAARTVSDWQAAHPAFAADYARARAIGFDAIADECIAIAEDGSNDFTMGENGPRVDQENIQRSRLRIDTRRWLLSKWDPKRYGDRLELAGDKNAPLTVQLVQFNPGEGK